MAGHQEPLLHIGDRLELLGDAVAGTKLVGTGQRITRTGYLLSAVIMVHGADRARSALAAAYPRWASSCGRRRSAASTTPFPASA